MTTETMSGSSSFIYNKHTLHIAMHKVMADVFKAVDNDPCGAMLLLMNCVHAMRGYFKGSPQEFEKEVLSCYKQIQENPMFQCTTRGLGPVHCDQDNKLKH
jgi:hypothetical protein